MQNPELGFWLAEAKPVLRLMTSQSSPTSSNAKLEFSEISIKIAELIATITKKERCRIGRELHDNVNQILCCAQLSLERMDTDNPEQIAAKATSRDLIGRAIQEIRILSRSMVTACEIKRLQEQIERLILEFEQSCNLKINFRYQAQESRISQAMKLDISRIVQEHLKNIVTHAHATHVQVTIRTKSDTLEISVCDDGVGFELNSTHEGIGLTNIRERVTLYHGLMKVFSSSGKGCKITIKLPLA